MALGSCTKEVEPINDGNGSGISVFTATLEDGLATRAVYNAGARCASWETGDSISVNGRIYVAQDEGLSSTFKAAVEEADGEEFVACFPAGLQADGTLALPSEVTETWVENRFNMPMYAISGTSELEFRNLCGVLKITVSSKQIASVRSIKLSSANHATSGAFTVNRSDAAMLADASAATNTLTVTYTEDVVTTEAGTDFYIAVPPQAYKQLMIVVSDGTASKIMTTKKDLVIGIDRNTIYPITFADNTIGEKWVQLWEFGPRFAIENIGAQGSDCYGYAYHWRGAETDVDGRMGAEWRFPASEDFAGLLANTESRWVENYVADKHGYLFEGKGDYAGRSIFLPAAGFYGTAGTYTAANEAGRYPSTGSNKLLSFGSVSEPSITLWYVEAEEKYTIRPVLKETAATTGTLSATGVGSVGWVQLWDGGPKFATVNVGVADASSLAGQGGHYSWGGSADKDGSDSNAGSSPLSGRSDTATELWGNNWRMPSQEEFTALKDNCDATWESNYNSTGVKGVLFTGRGEYSANSIFLPAAGSFNPSHLAVDTPDNGIYWTSAPKESNGSSFFFSDSSSWVAGLSRSYGCSVRAVVNE